MMKIIMKNLMVKMRIAIVIQMIKKNLIANMKIRSMMTTVIRKKKRNIIIVKRKMMIKKKNVKSNVIVNAM